MTIRTILIGLGTVNLGWLRILHAKRDDLLRDHAVTFTIVGVADSSGIAIDENGFAVEGLLTLKLSHRKAEDLPGFLPGVRTADILNHVTADLLIESSPANIVDGEPGLSVVRAALGKGMGVVLANKTPLVFAFDELKSLCGKYGGRMAYSATVCGGLPVVNVLQRDLKLATVKRIRGIFNATSNFVLRELERGGTLADAIREAQRLGAAEADPSHDLHGHDTANKLFIILKSFTRYAGTIADIQIKGIQNIGPADLATAKSRGNIIKLIAEALPSPTGWQLTVAPAEFPRTSFLGSCEGWEMGFEIETDLYERICMKNYEADPVGTSAAVMRDCLDVVS